MTWPTVAVATANCDAGTDVPATFRTDILDAIQKQNQMIAHVSPFSATLLDDANDTVARATLVAAKSGANVDITSLSSPALGAATATTAAADTNTTQAATTAFVIGQASAVAPAALGVAAVGTSLRFARADHVHASPTSGVTSLNGQTGAITDTSENVIGCYMILANATINADFVSGTTYAGSGLRKGYTPSGVFGFDPCSSSGGSACSGTWRCMSTSSNMTGTFLYAVALFTRVS